MFPNVVSYRKRRKSGERNTETTNRNPTKRAVSPERPPSAMPNALSIYKVMVELPMRAPQVVPMTSLFMASRIRGMEPSGRTMPTFPARPTRVPSRIDRQDVAHGEERGNARHKFSLD